MTFPRIAASDPIDSHHGKLGPFGGTTTASAPEAASIGLPTWTSSFPAPTGLRVVGFDLGTLGDQAPAMSTAGEARMSSVPAWNARPHSPMVLPAR